MTRLKTLCVLAVTALAPLSAAHAETIYGLTGANQIVTFNHKNPGVTLTTGTITGLAQGDVLTGIDARPANKKLYSLATNGNLYKLTPSGGNYVATLVGVTATPNGTKFGIDFNPVPDRLRFISDTNQNLRINPNDGVTLTDTAITLNGSSTVDIVAAAYINNVAGALTTSLFAIDSVSDSLLRSTNPNAGTYVTVGALGTSVSNNNFVGFDVSGLTGRAFANIDGAFFNIDLTTGASSFVDTIGAGPLVGLTAAAVPEPATWAMLISGFGLVGGTLRARKRPDAVTA